MNKRINDMSANERAFFDAIDEQRKAGAELVRKRNLAAQAQANRSQAVREATTDGSLNDLTQAEINQAIDDRTKALTAALRIKRR